MSGSRLDDNTASASGGALAVEDGGLLGGVQVDGSSSLSGNFAQEAGGALYVGGDFGAVSSITFSGSTRIAYNEAAGDGGVAYASISLGSILVTDNSTLLGNKAGGKGAYANWREVSCKDMLEPKEHVHACRLSHMALSVSSAGGAFAAPVLTTFNFSNGSTAIGNTASSGGVLYAQRLSSLIIEQSTMSANSASQEGGVVATETLLASAAIKGSRLQRNTAKLGNGGVLAMRVPGPVRAMLIW